MDINKIEVIVGSYQEYLLGYKLDTKDKIFIPTIATHAHTGSIRSVAKGGRFLASASSDETIALYDMRTRVENGALNHHSATVNSIKFTFKGTHLLSGCQDGTFAICRTGNWQMEKIFKQAHKGSAVIDIAIHPSDKLALTLGSDGVLKTWNLIKGRNSFVKNLGRYKGGILTSVIWSPDGSYYAIARGMEVQIFELSTALVFKSATLESRVASICFFDHILFAGCDNGKIYFFSSEFEDVKQMQAHKDRVKCLKVFTSLDGKHYLVSCSSSGQISLWSIENCPVNYVTFEEICNISTGVRITCLEVIERLKTEELKNEPMEAKEQEEIVENIQIVEEKESPREEMESKDVDQKKRKKRKRE